MKTLCSFTLVEPLESPEGRTAEVLERSDEGLFLASNSIYPPGTALWLTLAVPGARLPVRRRAEVAWARTAGRSGMYFRFADAAAAEPAPGRAASGAADAASKPRGPRTLS